MGSKKKPAKPAKPAKPKQGSSTPEPAPDAALTVTDLSSISLTLDKLRAEWPPLMADVRAALDSLATDEDRARRGAKTKGPTVLAEGTRWASQISAELKKHPGAQDHYPAERLTYLVERLQRLQDQLTAERTHRASQDTKVGAVVDGRTAVMHARKTLIRKMAKFAGQRAVELRELKNALGETDTTEKLAASVKSLTDLARSWRARTDTNSVVLTRTSGLTDAAVQAALDAARALAASGSDATIAGQRAGRDTTAVNVLEGAVLLEMKQALRDFNDAHEDNPLVPRLVPIPSLRAGLGIYRPRKGKPGEEDEVDVIDELSSGAPADEAAGAKPVAAKQAEPA
jgi:hypothetical protein